MKVGLAAVGLSEDFKIFQHVIFYVEEKFQKYIYFLWMFVMFFKEAL